MLEIRSFRAERTEGTVSTSDPEPVLAGGAVGIVEDSLLDSPLVFGTLCLS